jgi:membrane protein DedA with SNARE-associated domain
LDWVTDAVRTGGPLALLLVMLGENLFPPIPSEAVLPLAGYLVGRGDLNMVTAMLASTGGSVLGAVILYAIGRYGGRAVLLRYGHILRITEVDLDRADDWFDRHGPKIVFFARMVPLARSIVSVPAGTSEMPIGRFLVLTTLGSAIWNALLITLGYQFGERYEQIGEVVGRFSRPIAILVAIGVVALVVWWLRHSGRGVARHRSRP